MWILKYNKYKPEEQGLREALCALGNGYFVTRGAGEETKADRINYPGTYIAGGYNKIKTKISGRTVENEDLVNFPNWLPLNFRPLKGEWFDLEKVKILSYSQKLHIKEGFLERRIKFKDKKGRITLLIYKRFVHMEKEHLAAIKMVIRPQNWSGPVQIRSALDGTVENFGVERYKDLRGDHLRTISCSQSDKETIWLKTETKQSKIQISQAARTRLFQNNKLIEPKRKLLKRKGYLAHDIFCQAEKQKEIKAEKIISLYTSRDKAISESGFEARKAVKRTGNFNDLFKTHKKRWQFYWNRVDITFNENGQRAQLVLRLHIFHIVQTISMNTIGLDFGIPARGLHGEAYRGHIFWDEVFILPFFNNHLPEISRSLLLYRYHRLEEAKSAAKKENLQGALFPWQSGSNGSEESQRIHLNPLSGKWGPDYSYLQRHINGAIAYNVWHYYQTTNDIEFLNNYGAEMLFEIARLWNSLSCYNKKLDRYEIKGVIGPDEYHEGYPDRDQPGLNNNTYINVLAVWCLTRAIETLDLLGPQHRREISEKIGLKEKEISRWKNICRKMRIIFEKDGIPAQFEGYEKLEELDWQDYRKKYGKLYRLDRILKAEGKNPNCYKISKQADLLMLFYLFSAEMLNKLFRRLGYKLERKKIPQIIKYYLDRTDHGSSLSRVVHSWVLARSNREYAWQLFKESLESDISDIQNGTTKEGIHLAAMTGTVDIVQRCFTGMAIRNKILRFNPDLPVNLKNLCFKLRFHNNRLSISINHKKIKISVSSGGGKPFTVALNGLTRRLKPGQKIELKYPK